MMYSFTDPRGIAIQNEHMFWTDYDDNRVYHAYDNSNKTELLKPPKPWGITVTTNEQERYRSTILFT